MRSPRRMGNCAVCGGRLRQGARQTAIGVVHARCVDVAHHRASQAQAYGAPQSFAPARKEISTATWVLGILGAGAVLCVLLLAGSGKTTTGSTAAAKITQEDDDEPKPKKAKETTPAPTASSRPRTAVELGRAAPTPLPITTPRPTIGDAPVTKPAPAPAAPAGGGRLRCNDGTVSPTCMCGGSRRGCCSKHGGVAGCE